MEKITIVGNEKKSKNKETQNFVMFQVLRKRIRSHKHAWVAFARQSVDVIEHHSVLEKYAVCSVWHGLIGPIVENQPLLVNHQPQEQVLFFVAFINLNYRSNETLSTFGPIFIFKMLNLRTNRFMILWKPERNI